MSDGKAGRINHLGAMVSQQQENLADLSYQTMRSVPGALNNSHHPLVVRDTNMADAHTPVGTLGFNYPPTTLGPVPELNRQAPNPGFHGIKQTNASSEFFGGTFCTQSITNQKIAHPPAFGGAKFVLWKRDYNFWRDLYWYIGDAQLLPVTGLHANHSVREFMAQFICDTRTNPVSRTIPNFAIVLEKQFAANAKERDIRFIDELLQLKREGAESIQQFWFRWGEAVSNLYGSGAQLPDSLLFHRLLQGINVNYPTRLSLLSRLDCQGMAHSVVNLRNISIDLLGLYRDIHGENEVHLASNDNTQSMVGQDDYPHAEWTLVGKGKQGKQETWK